MTEKGEVLLRCQATEMTDDEIVFSDAEALSKLPTIAFHESIDLDVEFLFRALSPKFMRDAGHPELATEFYIPVYTIDSDERVVEISP